MTMVRRVADAMQNELAGYEFTVQEGRHIIRKMGSHEIVAGPFETYEEIRDAWFLLASRAAVGGIRELDEAALKRVAVAICKAVGWNPEAFHPPFTDPSTATEEISLHDWIEWFCRTYAPQCPETRARWDADLTMLVRRIVQDAQAPLIKQMCAAMALVPPAPIIMPR